MKLSRPIATVLATAGLGVALVAGVGASADAAPEASSCTYTCDINDVIYESANPDAGDNASDEDMVINPEHEPSGW